MDGPVRTPPRFVPTLTAVLEPREPTLAPAPAQPVPAPSAAGACAPRVEPVFLAVADALAGFGPAPAGGPAPPATPPASDAFKALAALDDADAFRLEEELLHRVLQRMDRSLEERLTDVVSAAVQQHLDAMIPRLRQDVEGVLRKLVVEAMAHELSETQGSGTNSRASLGLN